MWQGLWLLRHQIIREETAQECGRRRTPRALGVRPSTAAAKQDSSPLLNLILILNLRPASSLNRSHYFHQLEGAPLDRSQGLLEIELLPPLPEATRAWGPRGTQNFEELAPLIIGHQLICYPLATNHPLPI